MPVMPVRAHLNAILPTLLPESPFLLACQTILLLVPHPLDKCPSSSRSKRIRYTASYAMGERTVALVERMISQNQVNIECCQALIILALWEWGCSGDLTRNRARSGQAVQLAMDMGLHAMDRHTPNSTSQRSIEGQDWRDDMARRTWWSIYVNQLTSALVSGNQPLVAADDDRIHVNYPACSLLDNTWMNWINTNRAVSRVFALVNSVYYGLPGVKTWGISVAAASPTQKLEMQDEMVDLDEEVMRLMKEAEATAVIDLVPGGEEEVVRNQQLSARLGLAVVHIHIHRHQAFPEVSLFSKAICGLPSAPDFSEPTIPGLDDVAVPQALANGHDDNQGYYETSGYDNGSIDATMSSLWQAETFPKDLPAPWFTQQGGAAALYYPTNASPIHGPPLTASITNADTPSPHRRASSVSGMSVVASSIGGSSGKPHKAWGVGEDDKPKGVEEGLNGDVAIFPPGISLARCATAAHTIVRLEVLHRSAAIALWDGP
jgi:hypothetical protein